MMTATSLIPPFFTSFFFCRSVTKTLCRPCSTLLPHLPPRLPWPKAKILIIDDDYGPRESLRILLKYDYDVIVASSVADGLELLKAHQVDTIILDNRMPGRTGLEGLNDHPPDRHDERVHHHAHRLRHAGNGL